MQESVNFSDLDVDGERSRENNIELYKVKREFYYNKKFPKQVLTYFKNSLASQAWHWPVCIPLFICLSLVQGIHHPQSSKDRIFFLVYDGGISCNHYIIREVCLGAFGHLEKVSPNKATHMHLILVLIADSIT